jgi:sarcosine oxidase subunit alpha
MVKGTVKLRVDGESVEVPSGASVAVAILQSGRAFTRRSVSGEPRGPVCGMGVCMECRAAIDGVPHQRTCQRTVADGMEVTTDGDE